MRGLGTGLLVTCALVGLPPGSSGAGAAEGSAGPAPRAAAVDGRAMAREIDRALAAKWASSGVAPAPAADDAEFLRRVALDIAGRIPTGAEARAFLDGTDPDKRGALVEGLLNSPAFANHMTDVWKDLFIPEAAGNSDVQFYADDFTTWLRKRFAGGVGYDAMVREVLTVSLEDGLAVYAPRAARRVEPLPFAFLATKVGRPENLAASTSRVFLGVRLECAQCHDHPFAGWKREEFWGLAAFFAGLDVQSNGDGTFRGTDTPGRHELTMPGTTRRVGAAFLGGARVGWPAGARSRAVLADWVTSKDNPYFARATANRVWSQFFGVGLVDPVDDLDPSNEPSHPELLDRLAEQLAAHDFDLKFLIRAITSSRAYQLTSRGGPTSRDGPRLFDRMPVRGLTPVQLYDSLIQATGMPHEPPNVFNPNSPRSNFLEPFAVQDERPTERETSIHQALLMMNGRLVADATSVDRGMTLRAVADAPFLDTAGRVEALYLAALSRRPRPDERRRLAAYVEGGGPSGDPERALGHVFWSLLASSEFMFNH